MIRRAVWKECRLPVCVGMGKTLTLAKLANHAAKKIEGYQGVCVLDNEVERQRVLKSVDVADVWGIGRRLSAKLKVMKVQTAWDLSRLDPAMAQRQFSIEMERTVRELNGQVCKQWDGVRADKKQIFSTRSLGERITELPLLQQAISKHVAIAAYKARKQHSMCKVMMCFANSSPYDAQPASIKSVHQFSYPTADTCVLTRTANAMLEAMFKPNVRYFKIGVGLLDLVDGKHTQLDFLNEQPDNPKLMGVFDALNQRYGADSVFLAAQGFEQKWAMRRERLSPQYTTRWGDLPVVRC